MPFLTYSVIILSYFMERKLCDECQVENICKYEGYIKETAAGVNTSSNAKEIKAAMETITYLKFKARTKSDPCPRYSELEMMGIPIVVLDKNKGQKPKSNTK